MKRKKLAVILTIAMLIQMVWSGMAFAAETAEEEIVAAEAVEAVEAEEAEDVEDANQDSLPFSEESSTGLNAFPGDVDPDAEWGEEGKLTHLYFGESERFGHVTLNGDVTIHVPIRRP